jgi:DNA-binding winged helix-turn-helix (wHTH) protein
MLYFFENFVLDPARRELRCGDALIAVQPQVFDLLEYLVTNRDRVVSKDDILGAVWGGRTVSESALTTRINAARTAIGDDGDRQQLIRTIPRKGLPVCRHCSGGVKAAARSRRRCASSDGNDRTNNAGLG